MEEGAKFREVFFSFILFEFNGRLSLMSAVVCEGGPRNRNGRKRWGSCSMGGVLCVGWLGWGDRVKKEVKYRESKVSRDRRLVDHPASLEAFGGRRRGESEPFRR